MSPNRTRARRWLVERGLSLSHERALADELAIAEGRGEERVIKLLIEHVGPAVQRLILDILEESTGVTLRDAIAQPADDVADQHRAISPADGG